MKPTLIKLDKIIIPIIIIMTVLSIAYYIFAFLLEAIECLTKS